VPNPQGLLGCLIADYLPAHLPLGCLACIPARNRPFGLPGNHLHNAQFGRCLNGELVAIALGQSLHQGYVERRPWLLCDRRDRNLQCLGVYPGNLASNAQTQTIGELNCFAHAHPAHRNRVLRLVAG
jgi:hypothetical protein